jgi:hypothetical protein
MLDLSMSTERLTQGQSPSEMTVVVQRAGPTSSTEQAPRAQTSPSTTRSAKADPYAIAGRVYELMRQDLAAFRDRRGPRK